MSSKLENLNDMAELNQRVSTALANNPYIRNRNELDVSADEGRVVLRGTVGSYFQKQMAQESLRGLKGVSEIDNRLEVQAIS